VGPLELPMAGTSQFDRLHRAAAGAVQNADYAEDEAAATQQDEMDAVAIRRYQMSGRIQQTSAVVEQ